MKNVSKIFTILVAIITLTIGANAQTTKNKELKIGVVDVEKIVKEMPEALQADQTLKKLQKTYQDTLNTMQNDLVARAENYQKQRGMMTADKQKAEEESLRVAEQALYSYKDTKFAEISEKREIYLAPIRQKVSNAIEAVAKDESLGFVLDKGNGNILYSEEKYDITFKVIDKMKRGSK